MISFILEGRLLYRMVLVYRCLVLKYAGILVWGGREFGPGCYEVDWECYCTCWRVPMYINILEISIVLCSPAIGAT